MFSLIINKDSYLAGETIRAMITIKLDKPIKARGVFLKLYCMEKKHVKVTTEKNSFDYEQEKTLGLANTTNLKTSVQESEKEIYSEEKKAAGEGIFKEQIIDAQITIPSDAKPTSYEFGHDDAIYVWRINAKLDIPMALDLNSQKEVFVSGL